ncbi:hypothetical protein CT0861_11847 [Colletotrichum tofieldiae]|uniref:Uncharacterized protein n=1 Tax=Colletotrichum tofieldiae TaxID=708197 RepID=A0A161VLX4_9PEZI|nr:hypothetical protein CT0861_11847 [Colletotrichum tofieldiae]
MLASKLYRITTGFNSGISLSITLNQILYTLQVLRILVIMCLDLRSLYKCLVRLSITDEKRLMIDIISLRELYKKKEILEGEDPDKSSYNKEEAHSGDKEASTFLMSSAFFHHTTGEDIFSAPKTSKASQFVLHDPYSTDTGAAKFSTVRKPQVLTYLRENPRTKISWDPGLANIQFRGSNAITSIGTIEIKNPIRQVTYYILDTPTPFLFSLYNADKLEAYFNNVKNVIIQQNGTHMPVGHPFFNVSRTKASMFFSEEQLRRLHRQFSHPRTDRLHQLLKNARHNNVDTSVLEKVQKFCHHYQSHDPAPRRFKFSLKDKSHFNYKIVIDVIQLRDKNALHISTYVGPPDHIVHNPGTNFASTEFRNHAEIIVSKVKKAHAPLRRAYNILYNKIKHHTDKETILQIAVKALNNTAGPHGIIPTLLIFRTYPQINKDSHPSPNIVQQAKAVQKAIKMLQGIQAEVKINRAINTRNSPNLQKVLSLPIQSEVLV